MTCHHCNPNAPLTRAIAVTPSDTERLALPGRGIIASARNDVRITTTGGDVVTLPLAAGVPLMIGVAQVWETGTSADKVHVLA